MKPMRSPELAPRREPVSPRAATRAMPARRGRWPWLLGGGIDGNEQLTAMGGAVLLVLLAALGVTILRIGQLIWLHLFLGLLLLGPLALKLASTGWRFVRYYTRNAVYLAKGPPMLLLRAMGPFLVLFTVGVFATGVVLLFVGPRGRSVPLLLHKATFVAWLGLTGLHVLAHLPHMGRSLRAVRLGAPAAHGPAAGVAAGAAGRWIALAGALVGGLVLALALIPHFGAWTAPGALPHHDH